VGDRNIKVGCDKAKPAILGAEVDVRQDWQGVTGRYGMANDGEAAGKVILDS
jgi:hypothetical protein